VPRVSSALSVRGLVKTFGTARALDGLDLERFQLDPTKKARTYSKGNRQKVALVAALASNVELYLMDERPRSWRSA
jgi:energy-coupling factor transporter ATP-binding protein EcfA2